MLSKLGVKEIRMEQTKKVWFLAGCGNQRQSGESELYAQVKGYNGMYLRIVGPALPLKK